MLRDRLYLPNFHLISSNHLRVTGVVLAAKNKKLLIQKASGLEKQMEDDFKDLLKLSEKTAQKLWDNKYDES